MTHMVEHRPLFEELPERYRTLSPDWRVQSAGAPGIASFSVRCYHESTAARVAQALDLLEGTECGRTPGMVFRFVGQSLSEKEIMQRAREAAIAEVGSFPDAHRLNPFETANRVHGIRLGTHDTHCATLAAARALRDLSKPLADLVPPPVDPDLIEARKIAVEAQSNAIISPGLDRKILEGRNDNCPLVKATLAAIKRGRELAGG